MPLRSALPLGTTWAMASPASRHAAREPPNIIKVPQITWPLALRSPDRFGEFQHYAADRAFFSISMAEFARAPLMRRSQLATA